MKIFICASKHVYHKLNGIIETLKKQGHNITFPNNFEDPMEELRILEADKKAHAKWVARAWDKSEKKIKKNDAILVVNLEKKGIKNYIGGATFTEMFMAYKMQKKIFLFNPLPKCSFTDEINGMNPIILNGNLDLI